MDKDVTQLQGALNIVKNLRFIVAETLGAQNADSPINDWQQQHSHRSAIDFPLLQTWAEAAGDPAAKICVWGQEGAPMGVRSDMSILDGLWPSAQDEQEAEELVGSKYDPHTMTNPAEVESNPDLKPMVDNYVKNVYAMSLSLWDDILKFLDGEEPVMSNIIMVEKKRWGPASKTFTSKWRLALNLEGPKISAATKLSHNIELP